MEKAGLPAGALPNLAEAAGLRLARLAKNEGGHFLPARWKKDKYLVPEQAFPGV